VIPDGPPADRARQLDISMLAMLGGRERTMAEYERVLQEAGFQPTGFVQTQRPIAIVEGEPIEGSAD
jgi:hypothetical protein